MANTKHQIGDRRVSNRTPKSAKLLWSSWWKWERTVLLQRLNVTFRNTIENLLSSLWMSSLFLTTLASASTTVPSCGMYNTVLPSIFHRVSVKLAMNLWSWARKSFFMLSHEQFQPFYSSSNPTNNITRSRYVTSIIIFCFFYTYPQSLSFCSFLSFPKEWKSSKLNLFDLLSSSKIDINFLNQTCITFCILLGLMAMRCDPARAR